MLFRPGTTDVSRKFILTQVVLQTPGVLRCDMDNAIFDHAYLGQCLFNVNRAYGLKLRDYYMSDVARANGLTA